MSKGVHNIAFYVSPDPECSRTTQDSEISLAPSRGRILYAIYGNSTCVINHIVVTAIDKRYHNYYVSTCGTPPTFTDGPHSPHEDDTAEPCATPRMWTHSLCMAMCSTRPYSPHIATTTHSKSIHVDDNDNDMSTACAR